MRLALFDLDGTLLPIDSDHAFGEFMVSLGWADAASFRQANDKFYAQYQAERLDMADYIRFATACWRGRDAEQLTEASSRFTKEIIQPQLHNAAMQLVRGHVEAGDLVAIVTATNDFVTRPIAACFGIEQLIATELQRDDLGRVTGEIQGVPAYREGKVTRVQQWLAAQGRRCTDFERITFYSDSSNDLPLLQAVSHPVVTNPAASLQRIAGERGWPILRLFA